MTPDQFFALNAWAYRCRDKALASRCSLVPAFEIRFRVAKGIEVSRTRRQPARARSKAAVKPRLAQSKPSTGKDA
jgi:hypothetical protein